MLAGHDRLIDCDLDFLVQEELIQICALLVYFSVMLLSTVQLSSVPGTKKGFDLQRIVLLVHG